MEQMTRWGQLGPASPDWWAELSQMERVLTELGEIAAWLPPLRGVPEGKREQRKLLEHQLCESDFSYNDGKKIMEAFSRSGAPSTARVRAVYALEMLLAGSEWKAIIEKLCPYAHAHSSDCRNPIRREILRLKHLLRKYNVMPIDSLLPAKRRPT
jgi:hypothetical protein